MIFFICKKVKGSPYSITERRVPELIPVLGSQPAGEVSHKPICYILASGYTAHYYTHTYTHPFNSPFLGLPS